MSWANYIGAIYVEALGGDSGRFLDYTLSAISHQQPTQRLSGVLF